MILPTGNTQLSRDTRTIQWIESHHLDALTASVGYNGVTAIVAYDECGQMGHVPWLAIFKGTHLWVRADAAHFTICYAEES